MQSLAQRRLSSLQAAHGDMPLLDLLMVSLILQIDLFTNNLTTPSTREESALVISGERENCPSNPAPNVTLNSPPWG